MFFFFCSQGFPCGSAGKESESESENEVAQSCPTLCDPWTVVHQGRARIYTQACLIAEFTPLTTVSSCLLSKEWMQSAKGEGGWKLSALWNKAESKISNY